MNNSMVAHLWANEKKESARGSNFFSLKVEVFILMVIILRLEES